MLWNGVECCFKIDDWLHQNRIEYQSQYIPIQELKHFEIKLSMLELPTYVAI